MRCDGDSVLLSRSLRTTLAIWRLLLHATATPSLRYLDAAAVPCRDVFAAGASLYGVADAELLAQHTHKFESRYLDLLIGPYPEAKALYVERSPIHKAKNIKAPLILFQVSLGLCGAVT